jgi:hypothetical protein
MFDTDHNIPSAEAVHLSKLDQGLVKRDTCNGARLVNFIMCEAVDVAV